MNNKIKTANVDLFKKSAVSSISNILGTIISLTFVVILVNFLTPNEVGTFFFYLTLMYLFSQITKGISIGVRKRASSTNINKEEIFFLELYYLLFQFY